MMSEHPAPEIVSRRSSAWSIYFTDTSGQVVSLAEVIGLLAADDWVLVLDLQGSTVQLSRQVLERHFAKLAAAAGFSVRLQWRKPPQVAVRRTSEVMNVERIRKAMNEPPTW